MKKEKSCGAVVYKYINKELYILLLKHNMGHWSFSKGHIENEETEVETALREIKEETNLDVKIDDSFRKVITYSPKENIIKNVVYFIATPINNNVVVQEEEISKIEWFSCEKAKKIITYAEDYEVLIEAIKYLETDNKYEKNNNKN
jgi:8-oxo-dGTP pyrophosphatase MutT (NUDIX family)